MLKLATDFKQKYQKLLGIKEADKLFSAMDFEPKKAFRINTLKHVKTEQLHYNFSQQVPGIPNAFYGQVSGLDPEWVSGSVYSQDPSAMFPAELAGVLPGKKVLDLCAAPGGKSTALAEKLQNDGLLVSNEISAARAKVLRENIERWGIANALITVEKPASLAQHFPQFFDYILVDAPCSGEGMFRKNPEAINYWSTDYVLFCQKRQQEILTAAVKMLKPGGNLIYSTCTYAPEEDEAVVSWLVKKFGMIVLEPNKELMQNAQPGQPKWGENLHDLSKTLRFWPQDNLGEGQFAAKLKLEGDLTGTPAKSSKKRNRYSAAKLNKEEQVLLAAVLENFQLPKIIKNWRKDALVREGHVFIPALKNDAQLKGLKILNNGLELGLLKKKRFEPSHHLAMVLSQEKQNYVLELPDDEAYQAYLHGEALHITSKLNGFILVSYHNLIFSFGKMVNKKMLKNFYPKGLRTLKKG